LLYEGSVEDDIRYGIIQVGMMAVRVRLDGDAMFGRRRQTIMFTPTELGTRLLVESGHRIANICTIRRGYGQVQSMPRPKSHRK
jgi:hypothetical protein